MYDKDHRGMCHALERLCLCLVQESAGRDIKLQIQPLNFLYQAISGVRPATDTG